MHLFEQPELARKAVRALMGRDPTSTRAAARGARNTVFQTTLDDGSHWAVRIGQAGSGPEFSSGLGWARALTARGVPAVVPLHVDAEGAACGHPCSISLWSEARDAEKVVAALSFDQLQRLGRAMAGWSERMLPMIEEHPAAGAGLLRFGSRRASHSSWVEYLQDNAEWRLGRALANPAWAASGDQALLRSMWNVWTSLRPAIASAPQSLLAWDIADRNAMLSPEGLPVALVDVDELMVGDPLIAPALAWAALGILRLPVDHALAWELALPWERSVAFENRLSACKGYWLFNLCSKIGGRSATGLEEEGDLSTARSMVAGWIVAARRLSSSV